MCGEEYPRIKEVEVYHLADVVEPRRSGPPAPPGGGVRRGPPQNRRGRGGQLGQNVGNLF